MADAKRVFRAGAIQEPSAKRWFDLVIGPEHVQFECRAAIADSRNICHSSANDSTGVCFNLNSLRSVGNGGSKGSDDEPKFWNIYK